MKCRSRRYLTLLAILLALPAQAQIAKPAAQSAPSKPSVAQTRIESALENVRLHVLAGDADKVAYDEFVGAIKTSFESLQQGPPDSAAVRARLVAALDDIYTRARRARIAPEEFVALHVEVLDATLLNSVARWVAQPGEDGMRSLETDLRQLADAAVELDPSTSEWRARAQALIEVLKLKPVPELIDLAALKEELARAHALRSETVLEKHATSKGGATPTDFARVRNHVSDLLELQVARDPGARELRAKLLDVIDDLEHRAVEATLTHADFESLRKALAQRGGAPSSERQKSRG